MYQRILVPIDGSKTSERALRETIKVANREASLRLIYVLEEIQFVDAEGYAYIDIAELQKTMRQTGERALAIAGEQARKAGMAVETALIEAIGERVASVIGKDAQQWHADLIVIGTHGRSGLNRFLMGSVAEGVVRLATIPVLLIRAE